MAYRVNLKYNIQTDADIIARLEAQENKQDYIRRLILSDIAADQLFRLQSDIDNDLYKERASYWEEHCAAATDPDADCYACRYAAVTEAGAVMCNLEDMWEEVKTAIIANRKVAKHGEV